MKDILGAALLDWYNGDRASKLMINNKYGNPEEMPVDYYFRTFGEIPEIEAFALSHCKGHTLDIGAGVGTHTLPMQRDKKKITALEISPKACEVLKQSGVKEIIQEDIFNYQGRQYDTLLLLMNGIGVAQTIDGFKALLQHFQSLLNTNGQILFDSSDVSYLYEINPKPNDHYYGEVDYQYHYKGENGEWFKWLYVDFGTARSIGMELGFEVELLAEDDQGHYLCRMRFADKQ